MIQRMRNAARRVLHANCTNLTHAEVVRIYQEAWDVRNERDRLRIQMERHYLAARRANNKLEHANRELKRATETNDQHVKDEIARQQAEQERAQQPTHAATSLAMFVVWALVVVAVVALGVGVWLIVGGK